MSSLYSMVLLSFIIIIIIITIILAIAIDILARIQFTSTEYKAVRESSSCYARVYLIILSSHLLLLGSSASA